MENLVLIAIGLVAVGVAGRFMKDDKRSRNGY
jgi:hypothetical protein